jgi:hypothetical protein
MPDPALPASLAAELADLRRRLDQLERSPRLQSSSISGGTLAIRDDAGALVAQVGDFTGPDGAADTGFYFPDDAVGVSRDHGLFRPRLQAEPRRLNQFENVTGGTFSPVWQWVTSVLASGVRASFAVWTPAGVTGEVRLKVTYATSSGDLLSYTATKVIPADTGAVPLYHTYLIDFRAITNPVPVGADVFVDVEARRTAGASAMVVYQPYPL